MYSFHLGYSQDTDVGVADINSSSNRWTAKRHFTYVNPPAHAMSIVVQTAFDSPGQRWHYFSVFYVLYLTSLAKAIAFIQIVTDANSVGADIIVTESWLKSQHPKTPSISLASRPYERTMSSGRTAVCVFVREVLRLQRVDVHSKLKTRKSCGSLWLSPPDWWWRSVHLITRQNRSTTCPILRHCSLTKSAVYWTIILILFLSSLAFSTNWIQLSYNYSKVWSKFSKYGHTIKTSQQTGYNWDITRARTGAACQSIDTRLTHYRPV